jgi:serine/threonine-protein kinase
MIETFIVFAAITSWVLGPRWLRMRHEQKLKALELGVSGDGGRVKLLEGARKEFEDRVRNLESIVCGVDLELNAKLNRLASQQIAMLPAHVPTSTPVADTELSHAPTLPAGMQIGPGTRIADRYIVERSLGSGGMGDVYLARDEKLGEPVALKLLRDAFGADTGLLARFHREVTLARRISHPNVVRLHDLGQEGSMPFLSMEYVAGESLRAVLRRQGTVAPDLLRVLLQEVCAGLAAAHAVGVTHRDLKPENILVHGGGHAKIIDFGIAKMAELEGMTATRMILGTPQYMSPEQIRGRPVDARSDLYSLAIVAFESLTGKPPFDGGSAISVGYSHCNDPVPALRERKSDVDTRWEPFVARGLAKDPAQRFQDAEEMGRALPA